MNMRTAAGEAAKLEALELLESRRALYVLRGRRALLRRLLDMGEGTCDDVRAVVKLPEGIGPKLFGAVPGPLVHARIIERVAFTETKRREGHARPVSVWRMVNRAAAIYWLRDNPDRPDRQHPEAADVAPLFNWNNGAADAGTSAGLQEGTGSYAPR